MIDYEKQLMMQMKDYLTTKHCRWAFLLGVFNNNLSTSFRCGVCDNCTKR
ncbi:RecQ family zinc-binding domain-containing protein [Cyanobacterium sp. IPPAS B-1200]